MHDNERIALFSEQAHPGASKTPTLDQMGIDLTAQARQGKLSPVIGRDKDLERVIQVLARLPSPRTGIRKNNVALISDLISEPERGLRKMAIVEGLAQQMISHCMPAAASGSEAPEPSWLEVCLERLPGKRLVTLDVGLLVAGTTSQSEFEERFRTIIEELRSSQDCIIFIDEVHVLVAFALSAYGAAQSGVDVASLRVPALARGSIQCIGAATLDEYREHFQNDPALRQRFQEVIIHETIAQETILNQSGDNDSAQKRGSALSSSVMSWQARERGWGNGMDNRFNFGMKAIQPHLPSIPAFTEEDVRTYVAAHPVPGGGSITSVKTPTVIQVAFMTTQAASELIHNFISWHKEDLVCYVELEGAFTFHGGPPGYVSRYEATPADTRVFMILDAQSGNCFVTGFLPMKSHG